MKIFVCANWNQKFAGLLIDSWREQGHEVEFRLGYDPDLHKASDLVFVDACDNNARVASANRFADSRLAIRAIDIEAWVGQPGAVQWENVDNLIFGAKHIQKLVDSYVPFQDYPDLQIDHIPFGVDLRKWSYKERKPGRNVAFVAHRWTAKGLGLLVQVMARLKGYKFYLLGDESREKWLHYYFNHMVETLRLDVFKEERVDDVDQWLDDKDYLLVTSMKESFSYVAAEAAAKGIKPVIHNFWGADNIWPEAWLWNTIDGCVGNILLGHYDSSEYRDVIEDRYSLDLMMERINIACKIN